MPLSAGPASLWGPPLLWMAAIFGVSSLSTLPPLPGGLPFSAGHVAAYALLAVLLARALAGGRWSGLGRPAYAWAWLVSAAYGATDEWHQSFVAGRTSSVEDWLSDAAGAAAGLVAVWLAARRGSRAV